MSKKKETTQLIEQAMNLDTQARTEFLDQIKDQEIRSQVATLLGDEAQLQQFLAAEKQPSQAHKNLQPGTLIKRIRIEKLLGEGGMGSVYLGYDEKLQRRVAIKAIRPEHLKNPATHQRFIREAQIMSRINHPSICQLYDYVEDDLGDFLVMEYIEGQPLYQTPLNDAQKVSVLGELAAALEVAHEQGVVHRDLKPDNIMITPQGEVKVLDFGIAQSITTQAPNRPRTHQQPAETGTDLPSNLTQQGSLVGTIRYMSPEQARGERIDTASDIYAMGVIAHEIHSHQAAYAVMETAQLLADVQQGQRQPLTQVSEPVGLLIDQMTALQPADRPTASEVKHRIQAIEQAPRIQRNKRIRWAVIGVAVILLLGLLWQWQQLGSQANRNEVIKGYENQIDALVKQSEQIYVLPIHPVNDEIGQLLAQAEVLYATIESDGALTAADKSRLQGIIMLKAEYYEQAIPLLQAGQAEAALLADAWMLWYIEKASEHADQHGFEQTMNNQSFRQTYLAPALQYIEQAAVESGSQRPLYDAFVLSQTESLETALQAVDAILANERWNKEAVKLKALILSAMMQAAKEQGAWAQAREYGQMTAAAYEWSSQMARSYPPAYQNLCYQRLNLMADAVQRTGEGVVEQSALAIQACENALITQATNPYPKHLLTRIHLLLAQWQLNQGLDASDTLQQAAAWNQQTNTIDNVFDYNWNQALLLVMEAKAQEIAGLDHRAKLDQAMAIMNQLLQVESAYRPYLIGDALFVLAQQVHAMVADGEDPAAVLQQAQDIYDQAKMTEDLMVSEQWGLVTNMAEVYWVHLLMLDLKQQNLVPMAEKILAFLKPADNVVKNEPHQLMKLANTHAKLALYLHQQRQPIGDHATQAVQFIQDAIQINPHSKPLLFSQATIASIQAAITDQDFSRADALFAALADAVDANPYAQLAVAQHQWLVAQFGQDPSQRQQAQARGVAVIKRALAVDPNNRFFQATLAKLQALE